MTEVHGDTSSADAMPMSAIEVFAVIVGGVVDFMGRVAVVLGLAGVALMGRLVCNVVLKPAEPFESNSFLIVSAIAMVALAFLGAVWPAVVHVTWLGSWPRPRLVLAALVELVRSTLRQLGVIAPWGSALLRCALGNDPAMALFWSWAPASKMPSQLWHALSTTKGPLRLPWPQLKLWARADRKKAETTGE